MRAPCCHRTAHEATPLRGQRGKVVRSRPFMNGGNSSQRRKQKRAAATTVSDVPSEIQRPHDTSERLIRPTTKSKSRFTRLRTLWKWWKRVGLPVSLIGLWTLFYSLFPHLTLSDLVQMEAGSAFSYRLDVKNEGPLPVFFVKASISPTDINLKQGGGLHAPHGARLQRPVQ